MDQLLSAANSVGKSARQFSDQIETWASDGYGAIRNAGSSNVAFWGSISIGIGAVAGGAYAFLRKLDRKTWRMARRQLDAMTAEAWEAVRSAVPDTLPFMSGGKSRTRKRRSRPASQLNGGNGLAVAALDAGTKRNRNMRSVAASSGKSGKRSRRTARSRRKKTSS